MKPRLLFSLVCLGLLLCPMLLFAQSNNELGGLLAFLKGDGAFEKWFMEVFVQIDQDIESSALAASMLGRSIGGLGAMIYLGYLGYQMQEGAIPWKVTPMLRPIIIGLVLLNWVGFYQLIQYPLEKLAEPTRSQFSDLEEEADEVRIKRFEKQTELLNHLIAQEATEKAKEKELALTEGMAFTDHIIEGMGSLFQPIEEWRLRMDFKLQKLCAELIEAFSLTLLRVATYLIFFIQKIWAYILIVLGPIAVGLSLVPGFEHSFTNWIAKFIHINLYTFISYTIISIGQQLIISGYHLEIERYNQLLGADGGQLNMTMLGHFITNNGMIYTVLFPCVAYLVTGAGVLMTPTIADSIVSAASASALSKGKSAVGSVISGSRNTASRTVTTTKNVVAYTKANLAPKK